MIRKLISMSILLLILSGVTSPFSILNNSFNKIDVPPIIKNHVVIKIAILDSVIPTFTSPPEMEMILHAYSWESENFSYEFETQWLTDFQISRGALKGYDLLVIPGIGKEFRRPMDNTLLSQWKKEIKDFVANGGGYLGTCGGANLASQDIVSAKQRGWGEETIWEWFMNNSALGIAPVEAYQDMGDPIACSLVLKNPARIGHSAYIWYNLSIEGTGICQHCRVNKSHPIFHGYEDDTRIIRWVSGPALIPKNGNVTVLVLYPDENISGPNGNESTSIHAWRYVGLEMNEPLDFWDMEDEVIETHLAGKPAAIACRYGKGRVVIFGNHPEHPVWDGGRIIEEDTDSNHMLLKGLFCWKDRKMLSPSYNWWIVRRSAAWAVGIPDDRLPSIE